MDCRGDISLLCNSSDSLNCYLVIRFMVIFLSTVLASMTPGAAGADITVTFFFIPVSVVMAAGGTGCTAGSAEVESSARGILPHVHRPRLLPLPRMLDSGNSEALSRLPTPIPPQIRTPAPVSPSGNRQGQSGRFRWYPRFPRRM